MILCVSIFSVSASANNNQSNVLYRAGQIDRLENESTLTNRTAKIYAAGKDVIVNKNEVDQIVAKDDLLNLDKSTSEENALNYLVKRETLYNAAKQAGFLLSDNEVNTEIENSKNSFKNSVNYSDFTVYLAGRNITEDEYWVQEFDNIKRNCTINDYLMHIQNEYAKDNKITEWSEDSLKDWQDYKANFVTDLVSSENVVIQ